MSSVGVAVALVGGSMLGTLVVGLYPAGLDAVHGMTLLALALAALVAALLAWGRRRTVWIALLVAALLAGCGRALLIHLPATSSDLAYYNTAPGGKSAAAIVHIAGVVSSEPLVSDRSQSIRVSARSITLVTGTPAMPVQGDLYAIVPRFPGYRLGDALLLSGRLTRPPTFSGFDYPAYLAHLGVYSYMAFPAVSTLPSAGHDGFDLIIVDQRIAARAVLQRALPEPEASVAIGVVTGDRSSMPTQVRDAFSLSGTTHILAISGENISLLIGVIWLVFAGSRERRRMPTWLALSVMVLVLAYTLFTGASPSVVRAAIMGSVLLLGPVVGRRYDPTAALTVSAAIMVALDPKLLVDVGFQLSFLAMAGIAVVSPRLVILIRKLHVPGLLAFPLATGVGASLATWPVLALTGGRVSLVAPFATMTADFALAPLMIAGIVTVLLGTLGPSVAALPALLVWPPAWWLVTNAQLWAAIPWAAVDVSGISLAYVIIYYLLLFPGLAAVSKIRRLPAMARGIAEPFLSDGVVATSVLACLAIAVWVAAIIVLLS